MSSAESFAASVIRVEGAFNPAIVSPDWLLGKGLIDEDDREFAQAKDEHRMMVTAPFSGGRYPWIIVEVTRERLEVISTDETETPERLREFVVAVLTALRETPVDGLGITHYWHIATGTERWEAIAETVAPRAPWSVVAPEASLETLYRRTASDEGYVSIRIEPSGRDAYELYIEVEQYWSLADDGAVEPRAAIEALDENWNATLHQAERIVERTLTIA